MLFRIPVRATVALVCAVSVATMVDRAAPARAQGILDDVIRGGAAIIVDQIRRNQHPPRRTVPPKRQRNQPDSYSRQPSNTPPPASFVQENVGNSGASFEVFSGYDLPGNDYRSGLDDGRLADISQTRCQDACADDRRCQAFTYNVDARICFLKSRAGRPKSFAGAVAGRRVGSQTAQGPGSERRLTRAEVRTLQRRLIDEGFLNDRADGIAGPKTRAALNRYMQSLGFDGHHTVDATAYATVVNGRSGGLAGAGRPEPTAPDYQGRTAGPRTVIAPPRGGIREVAPVMMGDRLLNGFPLRRGRFDQMAEFLGRNRRLGDVNLALYLDLAILKQWPEILDDDRLAYEYAQRFLTGALRSQYIVKCTYGKCSRKNPYHGWVGGSEFEREATYRAFLKEIKPHLLAMAPDLPSDFVEVSEVELQPYDDEAQAFPLRGRPLSGVVSTVRLAYSRTRFESDLEVPAQVRVPRVEAPQFLATVQDQERQAYIAVDISLGEPRRDADLDRPVLTLTVEGVRLFSDPELKHQMVDFSAPSQQEPTDDVEPMVAGDLGSIAGPDIPIWNDRLLIRSDKPISAVVPREATTRWGELAVALLLAQEPEILQKDAATAYTAMRYVPEAAREAIIRASGVDPARIGSFGRRYWRGLDEFDRRALLRAIRAEAPKHFAAGAPPLPLPILAVCRADFREYDFDAEVFPMNERARCKSLRLSTGGYGNLGFGSVKISVPLALEKLPTDVAVPLAEAREFRRRYLDTEITVDRGIVYGIEGRIVGVRRAGERQFALAIEYDGVALFHSDNMSAPFHRLKLRGTPSAQTVSAEPKRPLILEEAIDLLLLKHGKVEANEAHFLAWLKMIARAEARGWDGPWERFFPKEIVRELADGEREIDAELLANFTEWTRRRAAGIGKAFAVPARSGRLKYLVADDRADTVLPFPAGGRSAKERYKRLAERTGLPETRFAALHTNWLPGGRGLNLPGLGDTGIALLLPEDRDAYAISVPEGTTGDQSLDVLVDVAFEDARIVPPKDDDGMPALILAVMPTEARIALSRGGNTVATAIFDRPREMTMPAPQPEVAKPAEPEAETPAQPESGTGADMADADIVGLRLGMTLAEADAVIRAHMEVGWIAEPADPDLEKPFSEYRAYFRADGNETIVLFVHGATGDRVLAVSRRLRLAEGTPKDKILASLQKKYGPASLDSDQLADTALWVEDFVTGAHGKNAPRDIQWQSSPCRVHVGQQSVDLFRERIVEGDPDPRNGILRGAGIFAGRLRPDEDVYNAWGDCRPTLSARFSEYGTSGMDEQPILSYLLADLSAYQQHYVKVLPKEVYQEPKL